MHSPYTAQPLEAYTAAESSIAIALSALVWSQRPRPWPAGVLLVGAIALVASFPMEREVLQSLGVTFAPDHVVYLAKFAAAVATVSMLATRRVQLIVVAVLGQALFWRLSDFLKESDWELAAAHLAFFGLLAGLLPARTSFAQCEAGEGDTDTASAHRGRAEGHQKNIEKIIRDESPEQGAAKSLGSRAMALRLRFRAWRERPVPVVLDGWTRDDAYALIAGTACGSLACWVILHFHTNSGDEWGNTYQAALFAKLRAYAALPPCSEALRSFWVMQYKGRSFAEYTPGWPMFMTPFIWIGAPWLAGPAALGFLASGVGRLGRRIAAAIDPSDLAPSFSPGRIGAFRPGNMGGSAPHVRAGGWFAVLCLLLSSTVLINGASRYPHVFVTATFAWAVEALCIIATPGLSGSLQSIWGAVLGATLGLCASARPLDGAALSTGLCAYFVYAAARRRVGWRAFWIAAAVGGAVLALTVVVLRLQMGVWLKTGYALAEEAYPWDKAGWSVPHPNEFRFGIPLATGAYCWFPCAPSLGLAGLAIALRGRERRLGFVFFVGAVVLLTAYTLQERGRGGDFGFGPRYQLALIVPMAVGTGAVLALLWARARTAASAFSDAGPIFVALTSMLLGVLRIAPTVYPYTYADVHDHNRLHEALEQNPVHNAVVIGGPGLNNTDPKDLTENYPPELYPNQDVLVAIDVGPESIRCLRSSFPRRTFYRAVPGSPVRISNY